VCGATGYALGPPQAARGLEVSGKSYNKQVRVTDKGVARECVRVARAIRGVLPRTSLHGTARPRKPRALSKVHAQYAPGLNFCRPHCRMPHLNCRWVSLTT